MKWKPILFSTPMIPPIQAGIKTQTRRVIVPQPLADVCLGICTDSTDKQNIGKVGFGEGHNVKEFVRPRYQPGDILWVRETWRLQPHEYNARAGEYYDFEYQYKANFTDEENACYGRRGGLAPWRWRPSIHMPREAARIFLEVTDVRVERVRDISEEDARAEGVSYWDDVGCCCSSRKYLNYLTDKFDIYEDARESLKTLWDSINAKRGYGWDANPWVFAYTFKQISKEAAMRMEGRHERTRQEANQGSANAVRPRINR